MPFDAAAAALATAVAALVAVAAAVALYSARGWEPFEAAGGASVRWRPRPGRTVAALRFRRAVFAVARADGVAAQADVTPQLNGMAAAYTGAPKAAPPALALDRPLNAFSFTVPGFNDRAGGADPASPVWAGARVRLSGEFR